MKFILLKSFNQLIDEDLSAGMFVIILGLSYFSKTPM